MKWTMIDKAGNVSPISVQDKEAMESNPAYKGIKFVEKKTAPTPKGVKIKPEKEKDNSDL